MTKPRRLVTLAGMIALATTAALSPAYAWEQLQIGQVYIVRTPSAGLCPRLEWHFVVDAHRSMIGSLECDWLTRVATLAGRLNPDDSFQLSAAAAARTSAENLRPATWWCRSMGPEARVTNRHSKSCSRATQDWRAVAASGSVRSTSFRSGSVPIRPAPAIPLAQLASAVGVALFHRRGSEPLRAIVAAKAETPRRQETPRDCARGNAIASAEAS
jgi:hypothetical protein